ncbi:helix-turn-helix domain-containing protein [Paenibacillus sp. sptzw28]|uniref:helix-turn-helix domain-containing protein n=1 Tax=Paenibacillus sp. sptzw28 TaxID=715179 RepID=UPI001C6EB7EE|nr:helix-turn-helix transcriptional regulator [Paenibacillus sp. sptzw28]QYR21138.1 helix-turn-helix domain-containing protein [Paenibacillus sp. sptzw28]
MHIGLKIKELRELKLWTQAQLAEISGVSDRTVRRIEATGKAESATLLSILNALDSNLEELENMFSNETSNKKETPEKDNDVKLLRRIEKGRDLGKIIFSAHQYGYDYHDCNNDEQINLAQNFLASVADIL